MTNFTYTNSTEDTITIAIAKYASRVATTGTLIESDIELEAGEEYTYSPATSGFHGVSILNDTTYEEDEDYGRHYILTGFNSGDSVGSIIVNETLSSVVLKVVFGDELNSSTNFSQTIFECWYAYTNTNAPTFIAGSRRTLSDKTYSFDPMFINDNTDYEDDYDNLVKEDVANHQHRIMFTGDTVSIPKIVEQAIPGRYLIFAIRKRSTSQPAFNAVNVYPNGVYQLSKQNIENKVTQLEDEVQDEDTGLIKRTEVLDDPETGIVPMIRQGSIAYSLMANTGGNEFLDITSLLENANVTPPDGYVLAGGGVVDVLLWNPRTDTDIGHYSKVDTTELTIQMVAYGREQELLKLYIGAVKPNTGYKVVGRLDVIPEPEDKITCTAIVGGTTDPDITITLDGDTFINSLCEDLLFWDIFIHSTTGLTVGSIEQTSSTEVKLHLTGECIADPTALKAKIAPLSSILSSGTPCLMADIPLEEEVGE